MADSNFVWPPSYYGLANELPKDDKRFPRMIDDFHSDGFDETELWCFSSAMVKFSLPRLKAFMSLPFSKRFKYEFLEKVVDTINTFEEARQENFSYVKVSREKLRSALVKLGEVTPDIWF